MSCSRKPCPEHDVVLCNEFSNLPWCIPGSGMLAPFFSLYLKGGSIRCLRMVVCWFHYLEETKQITKYTLLFSVAPHFLFLHHQPFPFKEFHLLCVSAHFSEREIASFRFKPKTCCLQLRLSTIWPLETKWRPSFPLPRGRNNCRGILTAERILFWLFNGQKRSWKSEWYGHCVLLSEPGNWGSPVPPQLKGKTEPRALHSFYTHCTAAARNHAGQSAHRKADVCSHN